jgi:hypothetical protein
MRGEAFKPDFYSRIAYRRTPPGSSPGFIFTYALRFVDGRGETIEERFEAIFVGLDSSASQNPDADMRLFTEKRPFGNLSSQEESVLLSRFKMAFDSAKATAEIEVFRRRDTRCEQLRANQHTIAEEALIRLGMWRQASENQLQQRFYRDEASRPGGVVQPYLDLFGEQRRRETLFRKEQRKLLDQEYLRRREIRAMQEVRGETIDAIGALVFIPEAML